MNIFNIENLFKLKKERNWDTLYWMIDLHNTIFPGKYASDQSYDVYPYALEVLKWVSDRKDMRIIVWTSSYAKDFFEVQKWFRDNHKIWLDWHNDNPECGNTDYADFGTKPYFNIGLDDKFGFCGETDWLNIKHELIRVGEW